MEQRQYQRVRFFSKAHLDVAGHSYPTEVLDLSLKGALVRKPAPALPATDLPLRLRLQLDDAGDELNMLVEIAHQHQNYLGLHCLKIDIDSISHLRRLLELNLGDAALLERELAELSGAD